MRSFLQSLPGATPGVLRSWLAGLVLALVGALLVDSTVVAAELTIADDVVVKFGANAELIVRDRLVTGKGAVLTSQKDDSVAGRAGQTAQTPNAGDWKGVRIERSATVNASKVDIRYAGALDSAALHLRGFSPALSPVTLSYFQIGDSIIGMRLVDGASPRLEGNSFVRNGTALDADGNSAPTITGSQFVQSGTQAILNRTPMTIIQAVGNWWGHATGPWDPLANPQGQGDRVSTGVNYRPWLTAPQLINPSIRLAAPLSFTESNVVSVLLNCINAVEYHIAESSNLTGIDFKPMVPQTDVTLSPGDGVKQLYVQYRDAASGQVTANLAGGIRLDTQGPALTITSPAAGSVVNHTIGVEVTASDPAGIAKVEFYVNDALQGTTTAAPYRFSWNTDPWPESEYVLRLIAYDTTGHASVVTRSVTVSHAPPPPDTEGPSLANIRVGGVALTDGATLTGNTTLSVGYTGPVNLDHVANGAHTLLVRSLDSLNNASSQSFSITVTHAAPLPPVITQPASSLTTRETALTVSGAAQAGKQIELLNNGSPAGAPVTADSSGRFITVLTLTKGANAIGATASDAWGSSAPGNTVVVTVDDSVPQTPTNLLASAQAAGVIRLTWTRPNDPSVVGYHLYRATGAFTSPGEASRVNRDLLGAAVTAYDDLPPADGSYTYRLVAVNAVTTPSALSNPAQALSDKTPPYAASIVYTPTGKTDPVSGRMAPGRVNVTVRVNEPLLTTPFLSLTPAEGVPLAVPLRQTGETEYQGQFEITPTHPLGHGLRRVLRPRPGRQSRHRDQWREFAPARYHRAGGNPTESHSVQPDSQRSS